MLITPSGTNSSLELMSQQWKKSSLLLETILSSHTSYTLIARDFIKLFCVSYAAAFQVVSVKMVKFWQVML